MDYSRDKDNIFSALFVLDCKIIQQVVLIKQPD